MNKTQFPKGNYLKHNTRGCWMFPDGRIVTNPRFASKIEKKAWQKQIKELGAWFFDSKHEANIFWKRVWEFKSGIITNLERKIKIPLLSHRGTVVSHLETDITFRREGKFTVEDAKGSDFQCTPEWKLKWEWAKVDNPEWEFVITYSPSHLKHIEKQQQEKLLLKKSKLKRRERLLISS